MIRHCSVFELGSGEADGEETIVHQVAVAAQAGRAGHIDFRHNVMICYFS